MTAPAETTDEPLDRGYDGRLLRRLLVYLKPYPLPVGGAVLLLLGGAGLTLVSPALTQRALDVAIPQRDIALLGTLVGLYLGALALEFLCEYGQTLLTAYVGQRVMYDLRLQIFGHLQRLSIPYFDRHPVGRLMTRVTSDVETLNELFSSGVVTVFGDVFTLVAIMLMMLATDWRLALVAFAVIPLVWLTVTIFRHSVRTAFRDIRVRLARLNAYLQEHLSGMRVVQLFGRERAAAEEFRRINADHTEAHLRSITIYAVFFPVIEVLTAVALALLLWYGGLRTLGGTMTVGVLAAFIQLTRRFFQPLQDLSEKFNLLQSAMASSERVFRLLDETVTVPEPAHPRPLPRPVRGEVVFEQVWFRYGAELAVGAQGCVVPRESGPDRGARRTHGRGEDHDREPAAPILRSQQGPDHDRRCGHPGAVDGRSTGPHWVRAAGPLSLHRRHPAQPHARRADFPSRGGDRGAPGGRRPVRGPVAQGVRARPRRAGSEPQCG